MQADSSNSSLHKHIKIKQQGAINGESYQYITFSTQACENMNLVQMGFICCWELSFKEELFDKFIFTGTLCIFESESRITGANRWWMDFLLCILWINTQSNIFKFAVKIPYFKGFFFVSPLMGDFILQHINYHYEKQ